MNDQDLDKLIRLPEPPARDDAYWEEFPGRVTRRLQTQRKTEANEERGRNRARVGWKLGLAGAFAACIVVLAMKFGHDRSSEADLQIARQCYREAAGLFPHQLQAVVMEADTVRLQLADKPEVPDSPSLLVRVCRSSRCATVVTFSGQQIEVLGGKFEVLANGSGGVILLSRDGVWTASRAAGDLWRFDAGTSDGRL